MNKKYFLLAAVLFSAVVSAQVKIGGTDGTPNANAMLEVEATDKGVLLPRVELESTTSANPLSAHVEGMTVYNTAAVGDVTPGQYYNDGTKWNRIVSSSEMPAEVTITADNGLTKTGDNIQLGGDLEVPTTITTDATNTLAVEGLQQTTTIATDKVVVMDANGVMKIVDASDFAKSLNTTVFKVSVTDNSGLLSLGLITDWQPLNFNQPDADSFFNGTDPIDTSGTITIQEDGVYAVGFYFRYGDGLNVAAVDLLGSGFSGIRINRNGTPLDAKEFSGANINLSELIGSNGNVLSIPIAGSLPLVGDILGLLTGTLNSAGVLDLLDIGVLNIALSSSEINTIHQFQEGDTITFETRLGGLVAINALANSEGSFYMYKISD